MLAPCIAFALLAEAPVAALNDFAKARDVESLLKYASPAVLSASPKPFDFLKTGGAYGAGQRGWKALSLVDPVGGAEYVVFNTVYSCEDLADQVYLWRAGKLAQHIPEAETFGFSITNHDFDINIDPPKKFARISDVVTLRRDHGTAKNVQMRIGPHFTFESVTDEAGKPVKFNQAGGVVSLAAPSGKSAKWKIVYAGVVNLPRMAGVINDYEAIFSGDCWWPTIARGAVTYSSTVRAPKTWTTISQGEKLDEKVVGNQKVTRYRMDMPSCVLSIVSGEYRMAAKKIGGVTYQTLSRKLSAEDLAMQCELNAPVFEFYSTWLKYPFSTWSTVASELFPGGALEAYSFATYSEGWPPDEDAHEPAHTWFGGFIPNTYLKSLWNESFASYCEGLYGRESGIGNRAERRLAFVSDADPQQLYKSMATRIASCEVGPAGSALGYGKGSDVLQMLEVELGTAVMQNTIQTWLKQHKPGTVGEWEDYEKVVNQVTGKDYRWFFDQWLGRPGYIEAEFQNVGYADGKLHGTMKFSGDTYRMNLEALTKYDDGRTEHLRIPIIPLRGMQEVRFEVPLQNRPRLVSFDPWLRLLRRKDSNERPMQLRTRLNSMKHWAASGRENWADALVGSRRNRLASMPEKLDGVILVGKPDDNPAIKTLCEKAGFVVSGDSLTFDGTTIDLKKGAALALVPLDGGGIAGVALGQVQRNPNFGRAWLAVVDEYGRFLRGRTEPKTSGAWTISL